MTSASICVDPLWFDIPGGVGTYVSRLVPAMLAVDPSFELRPFHARFDRRDGPDPHEPWLEGRRVHTLAASIRTLYPRWNASGRPGLPRPLATTDVVHATSGVAIPPAARGQRLVVTIHDLAFLRFPEVFPRRWRVLYRLGLRAAARRAHAILVPSGSAGEDLVSRARVNPDRVYVTPLAAGVPVGSGDVEPVLARLRLRRPYLLFVGTLEPRKNLVRLVRAYRRAAASGLDHALVLAGAPGWGLDALERALARGGPGTVVRTGWLPPDDLDAVLRGAAAFVYPSIYEGFGLPVLEAMARGVPTVTSSTSSLPEVAGDAALAVDPTSSVAIAEAIVAVLGDADLADRLGRAGRRRAERFTWDETARLTLAAYRGDSARPQA